MQKSVKVVVLALFVAGLIASGGPAFAGEFAKVGTVGTQFLKIPVGARGSAMGHAFAAVSNDASAVFWNPAGLVNVNGSAVMLEHTSWFADISFEAITIAHSLERMGTIGVFAASLNSGDIEETTVLQPDGTGRMFNVTNMMVGAAYAMNLTNKFSLGGNLKYVREDLDSEIASAWAVDVGTMYDTRWKTIKLSMTIRNFGPEIQLKGNYYDFDNGERLDEPSDFLPYRFPMIFKLGFSAEPFATSEHKLIIAAELEHPNDNVERYNVGAEYSFVNSFFLRGGYSFRHDTLGLSSGVGFRWKGFGIDYAYSDYSVLEGVHRFNVNFNF